MDKDLQINNLLNEINEIKRMYDAKNTEINALKLKIQEE